MDLAAVLDWLTGPDGGAFIFVTWAVSWGLEEFNGWHRLPTRAKSLIILALSGLLGACAQWLGSHPETVAAIAPYVQPLIYAAMAWLGSQVAHRLNPENRGY